MFPSLDSEYNNIDDDGTDPQNGQNLNDGGKNDNIGSDVTPAADNFDPSHPLYRRIAALARLRLDHPALADGAQQTRYSSPEAGIFAFSRIDAGDQVEYLVALNNAETAKTASLETYSRRMPFFRLYGDGQRAREVRRGRQRGAHRARALRGRLPRRAPAEEVEGRAGHRAGGRAARSRAAGAARRGERRLLLPGVVLRAQPRRELEAARHRRQRALPRVPGRVRLRGRHRARAPRGGQGQQRARGAGERGDDGGRRAAGRRPASPRSITTATTASTPTGACTSGATRSPRASAPTGRARARRRASTRSGAVFEIPLADATASLNYIIHKPLGRHGPVNREPGGDRSFIPPLSPEVWVNSGDPTIHTSEP